MRCLNCKNDVEQTEGKRRKLYCSPKCRVAFCRKRKPAKKSTRRPGRPKKTTIDPAKIQEKIAEVRESIKDIPILYGPMKEVLAVASEENTQLGIEAMIAIIKTEKIPSHRDTSLGRKSWAAEQQKRINDLESKLK